MRKWLMLVYTVPRNPTANRVYIWRKLKQMGAIGLQDAIWVLPATPRTEEQFQWLAAEIAELEGSYTLWTADSTFAAQDAQIVRRFEEQVAKEYTEILAALKRKNPDLESLSRKYLKIEQQDHLQSALGRKVRAALLAARGRNEP